MRHRIERGFTCIGILVAYMVLGGQFNSFLHPLTVLSVMRALLLESDDLVCPDRPVGQLVEHRARASAQVP